MTYQDNRTWSEFRNPTPEDVIEAERSLQKLRAIAGYCKPYDKQCHEAIANLEDILRSVERNNERKSSVASQASRVSEPKSVSFDPRFLD